jgi:elongation factor G
LKSFISLNYEKTVKEDIETGQTLVSGLGELHLEILRDRLKTEYNIHTKLGNMRVAYRESINKKLKYKLWFEEVYAQKPVFLELEISIEPTERPTILSSEESKSSEEAELSGNRNEIIIDLDENKREYKNSLESDKSHKSKDSDGIEVFKPLDSLPLEMLLQIHQSIQDSLESGVLLGFPIVNARVVLTAGRWSNIRTNLIACQLCTHKLIHYLLKNAQPVLLQPFMLVFLYVPTYALGDVLNDLTRKRAGIFFNGILF